MEIEPVFLPIDELRSDSRAGNPAMKESYTNTGVSTTGTLPWVETGGNCSILRLINHIPLFEKTHSLICAASTHALTRRFPAASSWDEEPRARKEYPIWNAITITQGSHSMSNSPMACVRSVAPTTASPHSKIALPWRGEEKDDRCPHRNDRATIVAIAAPNRVRPRVVPAVEWATGSQAIATARRTSPGVSTASGAAHSDGVRQRPHQDPVRTARHQRPVPPVRRQRSRRDSPRPGPTYTPLPSTPAVLPMLHRRWPSMPLRRRRRITDASPSSYDQAAGASWPR